MGTFLRCLRGGLGTREEETGGDRQPFLFKFIFASLTPPPPPPHDTPGRTLSTRSRSLNPDAPPHSHNNCTKVELTPPSGRHPGQPTKHATAAGPFILAPCSHLPQPEEALGAVLPLVGAGHLCVWRERHKVEQCEPGHVAGRVGANRRQPARRVVDCVGGGVDRG
eukprot:scaffold16246_cov93-Isochrysis_galbana.AAC.2